jgi:hypothetical protein
VKRRKTKPAPAKAGQPTNFSIVDKQKMPGSLSHDGLVKRR